MLTKKLTALVGLDINASIQCVQV